MKSILTSILTIGYLGLNAQGLLFVSGLSTNERRAEKAFSQFSYHEAAVLYEQAFELDGEPRWLWKAGESYYKMNDPIQSELKFAQALAVRDTLPEKYQLIYAQVLSTNQKYQEADFWFNRYSRNNQDDSRARHRISGLKQLDKFNEDSSSILVQRLTVNSRAKDFSPAYLGNEIAFVSSRKSGRWVKTVFNWDQSSFLDIYTSKVSEDGSMAEPQPLPGKVNSKLHEGPLSTYSGGRKMAFTRSNFFRGKSKKSSEGINWLQIFFGEYDSLTNTWKNVTPFPFNSREYSNGHPAMSEDGKLLYFSSDKAGGKGNTDIYLSRNVDGEWQEPVNLEALNTEGNEMFPYLAKDGILYFSSDGHPGLGGLDIYRLRPAGNQVENLGAPVNSSYDDFGFIASAEAGSGYFSSNRISKSADDDLFKFTRLYRGLDIEIKDRKTGRLVSGARISVSRDEGNMAPMTAISSYNPSNFVLSQRGTYTIRVSHPDYQTESKNITSDQIRPGYAAKIELLLKPDTPLPAQADIYVMNDPDGDPRIFLGTGGEMMEYKWKNKKCYLQHGTEKIFLAKCGIRPEGAIEEEIKKNLEENGIGINKTVDEFKINNIYFDYDRSDIRADAHPELDKLKRLMSKYPDSKTLLVSHTDVRGPHEYNASLSRRRSMAVMDLLVAHGINRGRIEIAHYGEMFPEIHCPTDDACTEEQHEMNRRTEIILEVNWSDILNPQ